MLRRIKRQPWHDRARELLALGVNLTQVAAQVGVHRGSVRRLVDPAWRQREADRYAGLPIAPLPPRIPTPTKSRKATEPWHHEARAIMAEIGPRYAEIARRVGKHRDTVRRYLDYRANERHLDYYRNKTIEDEAYRERRRAKARAWHARQREARSAPPPP